MLSLVYWICDDGSFNKVGRYVVLCTDSFTFAEVQLLISVLNSKFNLSAYSIKTGKGFRIIIPAYSMDALRSLVAPHMPSMFLYKLGL